MKCEGKGEVLAHWRKPPFHRSAPGPSAALLRQIGLTAPRRNQHMSIKNNDITAPMRTNHGNDISGLSSRCSGY